MTANEEVVGLLRDICREIEGAKVFFEWAAQRQYSATFTSIDVFKRQSGLSRNACIALLKELDRIGCGKFIVGRRNQKTRLLWTYGLKSTALVATGHENILEGGNEALPDEADSGEAGQGPAQHGSIGIGDAASKITEAKRWLADALGLSPDSIDVIIRA